MSVCLSVCLSVRTPYSSELILVRSDDRFISSLQMTLYDSYRPYIQKHPYHQAIFIAIFTHAVSSYHTTTVPYHKPCHIIFPPHRTIIPYHRHTISHTVPHHTQCHRHTTNVPYHIPYHTLFFHKIYPPKIPTLTPRK